MKSNRKVNRLVAIAASVLMISALIPASPSNAAVDIYITPGTHQSGGRDWKTTCEKYSSTVDRCTTQIKASQIQLVKGRYQTVNGWVFNNLTYKPVARSQWGKNPLANTGSWTATDGRKWRTECDTAVTGQNGCRSYSVGTVVTKVGNRYVKENKWVFNNMVRFTFNPAPVTPPVKPTPPPTTPPVKPTPPPTMPPVKPTPPPTGSADCTNGSVPAGQKYYRNLEIERCLMESTNRDRVKIGLTPYVRDTRLDVIALNWTQEIAETHVVDKVNTALLPHNPYFANEIRDAFGFYGPVSENMVHEWGAPFGTRMHTSLMNSKGHRGNLMSVQFEYVGMAVVCRSSDNVCIATQNFMSSKPY